MAEQSVSFKKGVRSNYDTIEEKNDGAIYFIEDDAIIATNDVLYGAYNTAMPDDLSVPNAIGGIAKGKTASDLKEKPISEILDMLLFPELQPTITAPSASISFKTGFTNNGVYEVGTNAPTQANFTTSFNQGKSSVAGKPDQVRAGALNTSNSFIYYGGNVSNTTLPAKVTLNQMSYNYHAAYAAGPAPITSYGNPATTGALAAGSVNSGAVSIFGTYPWYATTAGTQDQIANITGLVRQPLKKWSDRTTGWPTTAAQDDQVGVELRLSTSEDLRKILVPGTIKNFKVKNDLTGVYEDWKVDTYFNTQTGISLNGTTYTLYTWKSTDNQGANFIKIILN